MSNIMEALDHVLNWLWTAFAAGFAYLWKLRKDDLTEMAKELDKKADRAELLELKRQHQALREADTHIQDTINDGFADMRDRISGVHVTLLERLDHKADK